jgi:voltage-gated potassium channel
MNANCGGLGGVREKAGGLCMAVSSKPHEESARRRIYFALEAYEEWPRGRVLANSIIALIIINLICVCLESVPELAARFALLFRTVELASLVLFSIEYAARLWVAVEHAPYRKLKPWTARLRLATSPSGIVDLLAVLPFWFAPLLPADYRVLLVLRVVRFLKLARYSPGIHSLLEALQAERRALIGCLVILLGVALFAAACMHLVEGRVQPDKLGTIPDALWWAIVTLGTIGYGDVVPITPIGRLVASITIFAGLIIMALPIGIIATAFAEQVHRRDFVITWRMISRVPLFAELNADQVADIIKLLKAQSFESGSVITRRGEPAHSMFFIADGEVEIAIAGRRLRLGPGQFFGEVAVLRRSRRSATSVAISRSKLLVLDAHDLHALMDREERIAQRILEVARLRVERETLTPEGDLISEELAGGHLSSRRKAL